MAEIAEELTSGHVHQADREGIMVAWDVEDHQSGIVKHELAVGTTPGYYSSLILGIRYLYIEIRMNFKEIAFGNYLIF